MTLHTSGGLGAGAAGLHGEAVLPSSGEAGGSTAEPGKPIWLLDVDGVLNAVCVPAREHTVIKAMGFRICYRQPVIDFVRRVHESGLAEVRWLTTWAHHANDKLGATIGLPTLTVAGSPHDLSEHDWWKFPLAQRAHAEGRPLIWTDDDLNFVREARSWADAQPNVLGICPRVGVGLTDDDLTAIERFCLRHGPGGAS